MQSIAQTTPYARASLDDLFGPEDAPDGSERLVDQPTLKARGWTSDLFGSFSAVMTFCAVPQEAQAAYMALIDAARRADKRRTRDRFFSCPAWIAECYKRREVISDALPAEDKQRRQESLARSWRRTGWMPIFQFQRASHLGFMDRAVRQVAGCQKPVAVYTDRLTDLIIKVMRRARSLRGNRVDKFNRAAAECVEEFRKEFPAFAPNYVPEPAPPEPPGPPEDPSPKPPSFERALNSISRGVALACEMAQEGRLTGPERDALILALRPLIALTGPAPPSSTPLPAVSTMADSKNAGWIDEAIKESELRAATFGGKRENAEGNCKNGQKQADNLSACPPPPAPRTAPPAPVQIDRESDAERAVTAFASAGATSFEVTLLDETRPKGSPPALFEVVDEISLRKHLARYLERNETRPESLIIRPRCERRIVHVDDCTAGVMRQLSSFSFLQHWTSPGNGQAFIALAGELSDDAFDTVRKRFFAALKGTGANRGSSGSTRWPGSLNKKPERCHSDGTSPRVRLLMSAPGRLVPVADLERAGLLAPPPPARIIAKDSSYSNSKLPDGWPDYDGFLHRAPRTDTDQPDRSNADVCWSIVAARNGWPRHSVIAELSKLSPKAQERDDTYAERTVDAALRILANSPARGAHA
jgi:hypothetical protein